MYQKTVNYKWHMWKYVATRQKNGQYKLTCRVYDYDGYYCAGLSYDESNLSQEDIYKIFGI